MRSGIAIEEKSLVLASDHFNFDYTHFLPWHKGQCAKFHGHSSTITCSVTGRTDEKGMILDFSELKSIVKRVIGLIDHKVFIPEDCIVREDEEYTNFEYTSMVEGKERHHMLEVPTVEVVKLKTDSTVENLSQFMAQMLLSFMPSNVTAVMVQMNEGVGKSAVSSICRVDRDFGAMRLQSNLQTFIDAIDFFSKIPMVYEESAV
jgi:6-pyruvoyl tetrahydropterin synthase/QueD family protein